MDFLRRKASDIKLFTACILVCYFMVYYLSGFFIQGYQVRWMECLDYVADGTLYSVRPVCIQSAFIYYVGYAFSYAGHEHIQSLAYATFILLNAICMYVCIKFTGCTDIKEIVYTQIIYSLLVLPMFIDWGMDRITLAT